jgi:hypothetical protein
MKSTLVSCDEGHSIAIVPQPNGGGVDSLDFDEAEEESSFLPVHPLGLKPLGNQYTANSNARHGIGNFQRLPDEIVAVLLESLDSHELILLGSTCKFLYAFCRSDDLWKTLFIEYVGFVLNFHMRGRASLDQLRWHAPNENINLFV